MGVDVATDVRDLISRSKATDSTATALASTVSSLAAALAASALQPGDLKATAKSAVDPGWLLCDGSSVLRTAQPALFTAIGTTYGAVDGTHFTLPDLRGRVPLGAGTAAGAAGATAHALGALGGEETHVLTTAELAVHNHGITDPGHNHVESIANAATGSGTGAHVGGTDIAPGPIGTGAHTTGVTVNNAGSGSAHNNLQPYNAVNWWVKT